MRRRPHPASVAAARRLVAELRIRHPRELDVELLAAHHGLVVRPLPLQHEEGRLLRGANHGIINVAQSALASNKWRFVVAHELGHFLRHPQLDNFAACTRGDLSGYAAECEAEANDFAAELLMPASLFGPRCDRNRPSLHDIAELATEFQTSLTATALRFVGCAPEPCAVVHSTDSVIDWMRWSDNFKPFMRSGTRLGGDSYAGDLHQGLEVADQPSHVDVEAWGDCPAGDLDLFEHSRRVGPRSVLSLLWHAAP